jgi:hypothetical protein
MKPLTVTVEFTESDCETYDCDTVKLLDSTGILELLVKDDEGDCTKSIYFNAAAWNCFTVVVNEE